jgi:hypothetical protein
MKFDMNIHRQQHPSRTTSWHKTNGAHPLCHLQPCAAIPGDVPPSRALRSHSQHYEDQIWWDATTPADVQLQIPRHPDPLDGVQTTTMQEHQHDHPWSRPWTSTGATTTRPEAEIHQHSHQIARTVRHTATLHLKPCDTTVNRLPLVYKRRRRHPSQGVDDTRTTARPFTFAHDIGISLNEFTGTWRLLLFSHLACSPPLRASRFLAIQCHERTPTGRTAHCQN